ncbi:MAG: reverse transcriptase/maturase family protein [Oscillospiraceae bacterium]|nr:reverse transcriptase/maturase family protein [Oscillospiraceae bacterium]
MDIITRLSDPAQWQAFLECRQAAGHETARELADLAGYIEERAYEPVVERIRSGTFDTLPERRELNKAHSGKKRVVYIFPREEKYVLRLIAWLLHDYDGLFADNLYSFRRDRSARTVVQQMAALPGSDRLYKYKTDIHNYFNSIRPELLLPMLREALPGERALVDFLTAVLTNPLVMRNGEPVPEPEKGVMAGTPTASFLANLYLTELDRHFRQAHIRYARYSDDLIVMADSAEELEDCRRTIEAFLSRYGLTVNPEKTTVSLPGESWCYLGFSFRGREVDIAPVSVDKLKGKMRRKARALRRWMLRKGATEGQAIRAYIRHFNRKLFENPVRNELTWCRWYFPLITTDRSLRVLDRYMQECIRYIATGRHTKGNYNLRYETMKQWGYLSLVNQYYRGREGDTPHQQMKAGGPEGAT